MRKCSSCIFCSLIMSSRSVEFLQRSHEIIGRNLLVDISYRQGSSSCFFLWTGAYELNQICMHLADAFIQSDLQCIHAIHIFVST